MTAPVEMTFKPDGAPVGQEEAMALADLVFITTPQGFHPYHFAEAVRQGKHVFMEKPLAVDAPGVRTVLAASEVIAMDDDPVKGVRTKKDATLVRAADAVVAGIHALLHPREEEEAHEDREDDERATAPVELLELGDDGARVLEKTLVGAPRLLGGADIDPPAAGLLLDLAQLPRHFAGADAEGRKPRR